MSSPPLQRSQQVLCWFLLWYVDSGCSRAAAEFTLHVHRLCFSCITFLGVCRVAGTAATLRAAQ